MNYEGNIHPVFETEINELLPSNPLKLSCNKLQPKSEFGKPEVNTKIIKGIIDKDDIILFPFPKDLNESKMLLLFNLEKQEWTKYFLGIVHPLLITSFGYSVTRERERTLIYGGYQDPKNPVRSIGCCLELKSKRDTLFGSQF